MVKYHTVTKEKSSPNQEVYFIEIFVDCRIIVEEKVE